MQDRENRRPGRPKAVVRLEGLGRAALVALVVACGGDTGTTPPPERTPVTYGGGEFIEIIVSGGSQRNYLVVVPSSASPDEAAPVLFVFHGTPQSVESIRRMTDMDNVAGDRGWIVVYPQALLGRWAVTPQFFPATEGQDDVLFLRDIISYLDQDLNIDRERIYATGFSNGALMAQRVACDMGDVIAASVSVGSTMDSAIAETCPASPTMAVLFFLGDQDQQFQWDGELHAQDVEYGGQGTADWWAETNGCPPDPQVTSVPDTADDGTTVEHWTFGPCSRAAVEFYAIYGGGHTWPGSPLTLLPSEYGLTSHDISASEIAVEFMAGTHLGG